MSNAEKQPTDITTVENHSPAPPVTIDATKQQGIQPDQAVDTDITVLENHSPIAPALDLNAK
ncbi:sigma-like protein [Streptomyces sp. CSDS2]|uniref:sigma-like protein n=1 Tax=Streptomyces sp. CSDS2 TaxID=3055051 RepID=UPI0025AFA8C2|nr:sigma-like protein [Streptomyces sp. CSDS2]MDN3260872.1 sigma-like protein [Streptomyces sp. CSDS2]